MATWRPPGTWAVYYYDTRGPGPGAPLTRSPGSPPGLYGLFVFSIESSHCKRPDRGGAWTLAGYWEVSSRPARSQPGPAAVGDVGFERDGISAMPGPIRALHACALAPVTNVETAAAETASHLTDAWPPARHCRPGRTQLYGLIGLCRPSELKFSNLLAVQCSSTPLDTSAAPSITPRSTVRPELQSEGHCRQRMHVISEGKIIPVGLADVGSLPPLRTRHVRPRYCAVQ